MSKAIAIRLQDSESKVYQWTIRRVPRAINCVIGRPNRIISGWEFEDHDGYSRFEEGNFLNVVTRVRNTADNYGFMLLSNLS